MGDEARRCRRVWRDASENSREIVAYTRLPPLAFGKQANHPITDISPHHRDSRVLSRAGETWCVEVRLR